MMNKRGQGISLNVIIIAALALIVLVVLVAIFTGRIGIFNRETDKAGQAELVSMRIQYGDCKPTSTNENGFISQFSSADSPAAKDTAKEQFSREIDRCRRASAEQAGCETAGCRWR